MQNITSSAELKDAIQLMEAERDIQAQLFKDQFILTVDSMRPVNVLRSTLHDISSSPKLIDNILGLSMGITSGFLTNKIFVGASGNLLRKLLGSVLQFGVTNAVAQHPDTIKTYGQMIMQYFLRRREKNSEMP